MRFLPRLLISALRCVLLAVGIFVGGLYFLQERVVFLPRPYTAQERAEALAAPASPLRPSTTQTVAQPAPTLIALDFTTSQGPQRCFYLPAREPGGGQNALWVVFSGNGARALEWLDFARMAPSKNVAFLLVDYPGYGDCAGRPSARRITESAEAALRALGRHLHAGAGEPGPESLSAHFGSLNTLGHSIGAASALNFAAWGGRPLRRVELVAPFTSLADMARRTVGWPACLLLRAELREGHDNRARLRELANGAAGRPEIAILSGAGDEVIPWQMGRDLAESTPGVRFELIPRADHNGILYAAHDRIFAAMGGR